MCNQQKICEALQKNAPLSKTFTDNDDDYKRFRRRSYLFLYKPTESIRYIDLCSWNFIYDTLRQKLEKLKNNHGVCFKQDYDEIKAFLYYYASFDLIGGYRSIHY